jgi:hypothetical protein
MSYQAPARASTARAVSSATENRRHPRYAPAEDEAWLGWWEGRLYRKSPASLVDISVGGAKVVAELAPPRRSTAWICLDGPRRTDWVEAEILEIIRLADGTAEVRMAFREVCPYTFFEVAVFGHPRDQIDTSARAVTAAAAHRAGW